MTAGDRRPDAALRDLERHWNAWGELDPFWAILSVPGKEGNRWDVDEFFASGRVEVDEVLRHVALLSPGRSRKRALDFGCGIGRVTQAFCDYFDECDGVDIAASMIALAERFNRHGDRCRYHVNAEADLRLFGDETFDFVYSNIVLQHIRPPLSKRYLTEFLRVLVPGGVAVFQLPSEVARDPGADAETPTPPGSHRPETEVLRLAEKGSQPARVRVAAEGGLPQRDEASFEPRIEMWGIPRVDVVELVERAGGDVLDVQEDAWAGPPWIGFRYFVSKPPPAS